MDKGTLAVEAWQMGVGTRTLAEAAEVGCHMGARTLEEDTMGLEVDSRALEIIN